MKRAGVNTKRNDLEMKRITLTIALVAGLAVCAAATIPPQPAWAAGGGGSTSTATTALPGYVAAKKLIDEGKYDEGLAELAKLNMAKDADVLNLTGYATRKMGKVDEAIALYMEGLKIDPKHKGIHEYLGEAYLMKKDLASAEKTAAKLKDICGFWGCDELKELTEAIEKYKKANTASGS